MSGDCGHGWGFHYDGASGPCYKCLAEEKGEDELAKVKRQRATLLAALKELVACKDLKAMLEYGRLDFNEREFAESDYNMRKPAAWIAARAAIAEVEGSPKTSEDGQ